MKQLDQQNNPPSDPATTAFGSTRAQAEAQKPPTGSKASPKARGRARPHPSPRWDSIGLRAVDGPRFFLATRDTFSASTTPCRLRIDPRINRSILSGMSAGHDSCSTCRCASRDIERPDPGSARGTREKHGRSQSDDSPHLPEMPSARIVGNRRWAPGYGQHGERQG